ncbi:MAG: oxygen-dependent coproporphyrinogen oxidase [Planctomycetota bacterium]
MPSAAETLKGTDAFQDRMIGVVRSIQDEIIGALETMEGECGGNARFKSDVWERPDGGGGLTRVLSGGVFLEKAGVSVSAVHGELDTEFAAHLPGDGASFFATGVSLVLHPYSPHVPTAHANFRYIEQGGKAWIGGGGDLTPYYFHADDKEHFHGAWRELCARHPDVADYERFRDWCERYFHLGHRAEHRGVGGIFFDNLFVSEKDEAHREKAVAFLSEGGRAFLEAYAPIARRRLHEPVTPEQRDWQEIRRGRYVEFNLVHDRGTAFGLKTGGRTESILMSLPPRAKWVYDHEPEPGTPEAALLEELRRPVPEEES